MPPMDCCAVHITSWSCDNIAVSSYLFVKFLYGRYRHRRRSMSVLIDEGHHHPERESTRRHDTRGIDYANGCRGCYP